MPGKHSRGLSYFVVLVTFRNGERQAVHHVLNECLVDRGASPAMVTLQVSADSHHITTVQVDLCQQFR